MCRTRQSGPPENGPTPKMSFCLMFHAILWVGGNVIHYTKILGLRKCFEENVQNLFSPKLGFFGIEYVVFRDDESNGTN